MKFRFENFIAPMTTGRYGTGETAAKGIMIFPYSFVSFVSFFVDFFVASRSTALCRYFFPIVYPMIEPIAEPRIIAVVA